MPVHAIDVFLRGHAFAGPLLRIPARAFAKTVVTP